MRAVLETHFSCSKCGQELELVYEDSINKEDWKKHSKSRPTSIRSTNTSGGYKVESRIFIEPCETCLEPSREILDMLKQLSLFAKDD